MYSAGAEHPNKAPSIAFLERVAAGEIQATIDAEVLQEIMHRYRSLGRWHDGRKVYELARRLFPQHYLSAGRHSCGGGHQLQTGRHLLF